MEIRRCSHTHFIQAIRGGRVIKVHNTNSHGKPALSFKSLKDVYESIDAKTLRRPPTVSLCNTQAGLPMVERTLRDIKTETDEIVPHSYGSDNDLEDNTTLGQLKIRFLRKKRKFNPSDERLNLADPDENPVIDQSHLNSPMVDRILREMKSEKDEYVPYPKSGLHSDSDDGTTLKQLKERLHEKKQKFGGGDEKRYMLACSNESSVEDEYDLNEPIINLRSKCPRRSKAKRKCRKGSVASSSTTALNVICDLNLVSEGPQQVGNDLAPVIHVKVEDDVNELETPRETSFPRDSSFCINEVPCPGSEVSNGVEFEKPLFTADECEKCVTNEISYDHLEEIEPICVFVPPEGMNDKFLETPELRCHEVLEEIYEQSSSSGLQDLDMTTNCTIGCTGLRDDLSMIQSEDNIKAGLSHEHDNSVSFPDKNSSSSQDSVTSLKTNDSLATMIIPNEEHRVTHTLDDLIENGFNCITNINDELLKTEEGQASACSTTNAERQSSPKNQSLAYADPITTTEPCRPPEKLFSTRKAISPSSQEQLCSAMNSVELCNDVDQYKRKRHLCEGETGKKTSSARIDIQHAKIAVNHGVHGRVTKRKVNISSTHIIKKSHNAKINLEGPRLSHGLANLSTECTSIQGCSQSAIAFSERQMQDMESLAFKLMDELESMKCMVEQKLLFEAYRNVSLKSDADEVKSAISSASKMEETARKWLSTMARDCKRFCKIMKMTPNNSSSSNDAVPREKRKIVFADEAGGELCHVKFFEDGATPPVPEDVKQ